MRCFNPSTAIYAYSGWGPVFGNGYDLDIYYNSNMNTDRTLNLGSSYSHPFYAYGLNEARSFLAGSYYFKVLEIEVLTKDSS